MKMIWVLLFCAIASQLSAQDSAKHRWQGGAELDVLPYALGGYFAAGWVGKNQTRIRLLTADVRKPDITTTKGFTKHRIHAYALVADYFFKPDWTGFWIGGGAVLWNSNIQEKNSGVAASFSNYLLNGSAGYHYRFGKRYYLSPWAGLSLRVAGDKNILVGSSRYTLPLLNPEASLKLGIVF